MRCCPHEIPLSLVVRPSVFSGIILVKSKLEHKESMQAFDHPNDIIINMNNYSSGTSVFPFCWEGVI